LFRLGKLKVTRNVQLQTACLCRIRVEAHVSSRRAAIASGAASGDAVTVGNAAENVPGAVCQDYE